MRRRLANLGSAGRLAAFAVVLAAVAAAAAAVGAATESVSPSRAASLHAGEMDGMDDAMTPAEQAQANGLASSAGGFTLEPQQTRFAVGRTTFRFRIVDGAGRPAHSFAEEGGVRLHLIVVRRDMVGYTHVHPRLEQNGSWSVRLAFARPGAYRAFADFEHDGIKTVLGTDLFVGGSIGAQPLPLPRNAAVVDGYRVALAAPRLHAGKEATLTFAVTRGGERVGRFENYVGMRGHLVALHEGDLAYSHVHPLEGSKSGEIDFHTKLQTPGRYRLFLQFKTQGHVHTAPFTVEVQR
jgi:hypothetical protein